MYLSVRVHVTIRKTCIVYLCTSTKRNSNVAAFKKCVMMANEIPRRYVHLQKPSVTRTEPPDGGN